MRTDDFIDILKMNSMGITAARISILQFLHEKNQAFIELNQIIKLRPGYMNRTTLYRTLLTFCSANLLYKLVGNKNKVYYGIGENLRIHLKIRELTNKNNYHFQCGSCGKIFCLSTKMHTIDLPYGFTKAASSLLLSGECNICSKKIL